MLSGICTTVKALQPNCKVIAVEPEGKELEDHIKRKTGWTRPMKYLETKAEGIKGTYIRKGKVQSSIGNPFAKRRLQYKSCRGFVSAFHRFRELQPLK
jgi:cysteine synthase